VRQLTGALFNMGEPIEESLGFIAKDELDMPHERINVALMNEKARPVEFAPSVYRAFAVWVFYE
jgi:hypothetical protein